MRRLVCLAAVAAVIAGGACGAAAQGCGELPHGDHPRAALSNGALDAVLFLPDAATGYYRGSRFDWAGVIGCVAYKGHTYFGEWFPRYDPLVNDSITGPVEEFRGPDGELGYNDAGAGGNFLKIGVGVLRRIDEKAYTFGGAYPIVDGGTRTTRVRKRSVTFTQEVRTGFGYAYRYTKTVRLDRHGAALTLEHRLTNLGTKAIVTEVYDHDFFMLDHKPTGPGMVVRLGFVPVAAKPFPSTASIVGQEIVFHEALGPRNRPAGYLTGYTGKAGEYDFTVEDRTGHVGVEQTSKSPISKFYFWSTPETICPEAYLRVDVGPGKTQTWAIRYAFKAE